MQYDSTCRDAKCWVECQAEARESAGEMITIFWTLARLLEMYSAKNSVGKWPATRCSSNDEIPRFWLGRERHWTPAVGASDSGSGNHDLREMTQQGKQTPIRYRGSASRKETMDLVSNSKEQPLLLGRYSLALSTPLGIYSLALSTLLGSVCPETNAWGSTVVRTCWGLKNPTLWSALQG